MATSQASSSRLGCEILKTFDVRNPPGQAAPVLGEELGPPFKRGRGGPGGWFILDEPELHLRGDILVPDLAGWRKERMPALTTSEPPLSGG